MKKILGLILLSLTLGNNIWAQNITVRGKVVSSNDRMGLPGVNVIIKGTTQGTVTDADGNFILRVSSPSSVLRISSIGFVTEEIVVGNSTDISVSLEPDSQSLEDVVVIGYGEQKKTSIVGAISNIKSDELKRAAPNNLTGAIAGRVTGALVRLGDGNLGGGDNRYTNAELDNAEIFIRGKATTNSAQPLILVDGVESSFSRINPEDVDQFSVLKDASATAVYGVRGANGVILITTKKGVEGRPKITVNSQMRMHQTMAFPRPLGAYDYAVLYNEALYNVGKAPLYSEEDLAHWRTGDDPFGHPDIDWYDELVKDHFFEQQHNVNISGGTEAVKYYVSGEYNHGGGPFDAGEGLESTYDRYNLRSNFDFRVTRSTELSVKLNGRFENKGDVNYGESTGQRYYGSFWWGILTSLGNVAPIYNPNGTYAYGTNNVWNLIPTLKEGGYRRRLSNTMDANVQVRQNLDFITPGLSVRGMFGSVFSSGTRKTAGGEQIPALWDYNVSTGKYTLRRAEAARTYSIARIPYTRRKQWEFALNYDKNIAEKHHLSAMAIYIQSSGETDYTLPVSYRGIAGRLTYEFDSRYLAEVNLGYNGSDQFSKGNRYALLPAASLGWVVSEENFMRANAGFIDFLKIRGSYGTAGNDKIGSYRYLYQYEFTPTSGRWTDYQNEIYNFGVTPVQQTGMREGSLGNDKVSWEIAAKANVGLDLRAFENKLSFTGDIFQEKRDNILVIRGDVPTQTGLNSSKLPAQNLGKVTNRGFELELAWNHTFGDFGYGLGGNYTFARSNIDYIAEVQQEYAWMMRVNHPVGQPFGYTWTGKFYDFPDIENPEVPKPVGTVYPGDLMFKDLNEDGVIDNRDISAIAYSSIPEIIYGFNTNLSFKNFFFDTFWQGAAHVSSRFGAELRYEFSPNVLPFHLDRWAYNPEKGIDTRATAKYPSLIIGGSSQTKANSTFQYLNSNYVRLKSAEFGYNIPKYLLKRVRISDARIFVSGSNLLTFDKIKYIDPEYKDNTRGNYYPQTKFYAIGASLTF